MSRQWRRWFGWMVVGWCTALPSFAADFDADGNDDLLFRDRSSGEQRLALVLAGSGPARLAARVSLLLGTDTARGYAVYTGDFDGDGQSDILDRDLASGRIRVRLMDGIRVRSSGSLAAVPLDTTVTLEAIADLNGDGRDDLVFRDSASGTWRLRLMKGLADMPLGTETATCGRDPALRLVEAADFDGDGRADLLLRHATTLAWSLCRLNGLRVLDLATISALPRDPLWLLQARADMNLDGLPDLLFRNRESGAWYTWFLRGSSVLTLSGPTGITTNTAWRLQALTDVDGDRYPDAVLMRPDTGQLHVALLMGRSRLTGSGSAALPAEPGARLAASGDFSAGGGNELLYRDTQGQWSIATLATPSRVRLEAVDLPAADGLSHACTPPRVLPLGALPPLEEAAFADAFLSWTHPVTRANGDPLCAYERSGYVLYLQSTTMNQPRQIEVGDPQQEFQVIDSLQSGRWLFSIRAIDLGGLLSPPSARSLKFVR